MEVEEKEKEDEGNVRVTERDKATTEGRGSVSRPPNLRRGVERPRGKSAARPTDTMLRLNIRCLNNQARFDLQRRPAKRRQKREES